MRSPISEANQWISRLNLIPNRAQVILGLGMGVHVFEFAKITEEPIFVIDPRNFLVAKFERLPQFEQFLGAESRRIQVGGYPSIFSQLRETRYQVQQYRPCWGDLTEEFINTLDLLNLRNLETAAAKYIIHPQRRNELVSLADIEAPSDQIRLLQELVR